MVVYNIEIKEGNKQPHMDIEHDIALKKDGLFTFVIRVSSKQIIDYVNLDYSSYENTDTE